MPPRMLQIVSPALFSNRDAVVINNCCPLAIMPETEDLAIVIVVWLSPLTNVAVPEPDIGGFTIPTMGFLIKYVACIRKYPVTSALDLTNSTHKGMSSSSET